MPGLNVFKSLLNMGGQYKREESFVYTDKQWPELPCPEAGVLSLILVVHFPLGEGALVPQSPHPSLYG